MMSLMSGSGCSAAGDGDLHAMGIFPLFFAEYLVVISFDESLLFCQPGLTDFEVRRRVPTDRAKAFEATFALQFLDDGAGAICQTVR